VPPPLSVARTAAANSTSSCPSPTFCPVYQHKALPIPPLRPVAVSIDLDTGGHPIGRAARRQWRPNERKTESGVKERPHSRSTDLRRGNCKIRLLQPPTPPLQRFPQRTRRSPPPHPRPPAGKRKNPPLPPPPPPPHAVPPPTPAPPPPPLHCALCPPSFGRRGSLQVMAPAPAPGDGTLCRRLMAPPPPPQILERRAPPSYQCARFPPSIGRRGGIRRHPSRRLGQQTSSPPRIRARGLRIGQFSDHLDILNTHISVIR